MKSFGTFLAAASLCLSGYVQAQTPSYNSSIYNGGDYPAAAQLSL